MSSPKPHRYNAEATERREERQREKEYKEIEKEIDNYYFPRGEEAKAKRESGGYGEGEDINLGTVRDIDGGIRGKEGDAEMRLGDVSKLVDA